MPDDTTEATPTRVGVTEDTQFGSTQFYTANSWWFDVDGALHLEQNGLAVASHAKGTWRRVFVVQDSPVAEQPVLRTASVRSRSL